MCVPGLYVCMSICMHACVYVRTYACMYVYVYAYTHVYIHIYTYIYIYIHMYTHTYTHTYGYIRYILHITYTKYKSQQIDRQGQIRKKTQACVCMNFCMSRLQTKKFGFEAWRHGVCGSGFRV